jgi:hypothetical protein
VEKSQKLNRLHRLKPINSVLYINSDLYVAQYITNLYAAQYITNVYAAQYITNIFVFSRISRIE